MVFKEKKNSVNNTNYFINNNSIRGIDESGRFHWFRLEIQYIIFVDEREVHAANIQLLAGFVSPSASA